MEKGYEQNKTTNNRFRNPSFIHDLLFLCLQGDDGDVGPRGLPGEPVSVSMTTKQIFHLQIRFCVLPSHAVPVVSCHLYLEDSTCSLFLLDHSLLSKDFLLLLLVLNNSYFFSLCFSVINLCLILDACLCCFYGFVFRDHEVCLGPKVLLELMDLL